MKLTITSFFIFLHIYAYAQPYTDYIGAGHSQGIKVTTSSDDEREDFISTANGTNTIAGKGLDFAEIEASRFLTHTTYGFTQKDIDKVIKRGYEAWLEEQFNWPVSNYLQRTDSIARAKYEVYLSLGVDSSEISPYPYWTDWRYAWWDINVRGEDQLRQRVAFALSQILVISDDSDIGGHATALASYYDLLSKHAFGNYRDLLLDVTLHPAMGFYLSHLNNPREIPEENIHPDQNYAREIMQLFTIGLYELNIDGSRRKDVDGNDIPTYNNEHIAELAKVFTGLGIGAALPDMGDLYFGRGIYGSDLTYPMAMYEEWHQEGSKQLINGVTIPTGQAGMKDIEDAIDMLMNHPNIGPFISKQLIQRFITSNPTPEYVTRVASVFNNDGNGVKGNLKAVITAIIMDDEARNCEWTGVPSYGKLSEPTLRHTQFLKSVGTNSPSGYFFNIGTDLENSTFQHPLSSESVFNFYSPDHIPNGPISADNLVAPEFQLVNSLTTLEYSNLVQAWSIYEYGIGDWEDDYFNSYVNGSKFFESAHDDEVLINHLDLLFCNGSLSDFTRDVIKEALKVKQPSLHGYIDKIQFALYLIFISPDYLIKK